MPKLFRAPNETIAGLNAQLREGNVSCKQLLQQCKNNYDRFEPDVGAWVCVDWEHAAYRAGELDASFQRGEPTGVLHGMVVGIKDIIDVSGFATAAGASFWKDELALEDAPVVQRLRKAGAIILGKTVTTQHAFFDPAGTSNPWKYERTPGGSSSGSAAAVASEMCHLALGSQTGGSINRPASFCGVAGFKPTYATISVKGVRPLSPSLDHVGPIAGSVEDLIICMSVLAEDDFQRQRLGKLVSVAESTEVTDPPRLAVAELFSDQLSGELADALKQATQGWQTHGAELVPIETPKPFASDVLKMHRTIMSYECAQVHRENFQSHADDYLPHIRKLIEEGQATDASQYERALDWQAEWRQRLGNLLAESNVHALLLPATAGPAPDKSTTGDPLFNSPWSLTGMPSVSYPIGLSSDSLPLAAQLVGQAGQDATVLRAALWCERVLATS